MSTTTVLILNCIVAIGLLAALAIVMRLGHRVGGSTSATAHWSGPRELGHVREIGARPDLERAA